MKHQKMVAPRRSPELPEPPLQAPLGLSLLTVNFQFLVEDMPHPSLLEGPSQLTPKEGAQPLVTQLPSEEAIFNPIYKVSCSSLLSPQMLYLQR